MLVLTRRSGERLRLGNDIVITVVKVVGGAVRIGIEAPLEVKVLREELLPPHGPTPNGCQLDITAGMPPPPPVDGSGQGSTHTDAA